MEFIFTTIAVVTGMSFSLALAILAEELIFGKLFGWFFARPTAKPQAGVER